MRALQIKKGATRCVFLLGTIVVKTPRWITWKSFLNGLLANIQEREFWLAFHSPMLAKIIYSDPAGLCVVMERADEVFQDTGICTKERRKLNRFFVSCENTYLPVDRHFSNIGRFGNKLKLIDYGN